MGTHYDGTKAERTALDAFIKLIRAADSVTSVMSTHLAERGLTPSQFGILEAVYHLGPMCQKSLGEKLLKSGGNITVVVNNLEDDGLVRRERMESDRRFVKIYLTDRGEELIAKVVPDHVQQVVERFSALTVEEQDTLADLCRKLGKA